MPLNGNWGDPFDTIPYTSTPSPAILYTCASSAATPYTYAPSAIVPYTATSYAPTNVYRYNYDDDKEFAPYVSTFYGATLYVSMLASATFMPTYTSHLYSYASIL